VSTLVATVETAIEELRATFLGAEITISPDGTGGARVIVSPVPLSEIYRVSETWIGGHLVALLPYADVYPLFVRGDLQRVDGKPLGVGLGPGHVFEGRAAVQASRRSNKRDATIETVGMKFLKVLTWLQTHTGG